MIFLEETTGRVYGEQAGAGEVPDRGIAMGQRRSSEPPGARTQTTINQGGDTMQQQVTEFQVEVQYHSASGRLAYQISRRVAGNADGARWIARQTFEAAHSEPIHVVNVYRID